MKTSRIIFLLTALLTASALGAGGRAEAPAATPGSSVPRPESIRITTLRGPTGIGMLKLLEAGVLPLADGTTIPLSIEVAGGPEILDARILGGQADVITAPVNQAARLYTKGDLVRLGGVNVWGVLYVLSTDPAVRTWADLKGRSILASDKGSTTDVSFRELASRQGLDPLADLKLDYSFGHAEVMQLIAAGKHDLVLLPEPFVSRALQVNPKARIVLDLQATWKEAFGSLEQAQGGVALATTFVKQYPEVARAFLQAYAASCAEVLSAADAPARIARQDFGLDEASARASLPRINLRYVDAVTAGPAVRAYLEVLYRANPASVGDRLPDEGFLFR